MSVVPTRRLQLRQIKLWADEVVALQFCLIFLSVIRSFQVTDADPVPKFHGIVINLLLSNLELDDVISVELAFFLPSIVMVLLSRPTKLRSV